MRRWQYQNNVIFYKIDDTGLYFFNNIIIQRNKFLALQLLGRFFLGFFYIFISFFLMVSSIVYIIVLNMIK